MTIRHYNHYILIIISYISSSLSLLFNKTERRVRNKKVKTKFIHVLVLFIIIIIIIIINNKKKCTLQANLYYTYIHCMMNKKKKIEYMSAYICNSSSIEWLIDSKWWVEIHFIISINDNDDDHCHHQYNSWNNVTIIFFCFVLFSNQFSLSTICYNNSILHLFIHSFISFLLLISYKKKIPFPGHTGNFYSIFVNRKNNKQECTSIVNNKQTSG